MIICIVDKLYTCKYYDDACTYVNISYYLLVGMVRYLQAHYL